MNIKLHELETKQWPVVEDERLIIECDSLNNAQKAQAKMMDLIRDGYSVELKPSALCQDKFNELNEHLLLAYQQARVATRNNTGGLHLKKPKTYTLHPCADSRTWLMKLQQPFNEKKWQKELMQWIKTQGTEQLTIELLTPNQHLALNIPRLIRELCALKCPVHIIANDLTANDQAWLTGLFIHQQRKLRQVTKTKGDALVSDHKTPLSRKMMAWLNDEAIEVGTEKQFQRQVANEQQVTAQQQKTVSKNVVQQQQVAQQHTHETSLDHLGELIHEDNLQLLVTDKLSLNQVKGIWYGLVGSTAGRVTDPQNRITHVPRTTMELIIAHREQFSGGVLFGKLASGFVFTVVTNTATSPQSVLYFAEKNPQMSAADDPLLPTWIYPPVPVDRQNPGTVHQLYSFKKGCLTEAHFKEFVVAKELSFNVIFGNITHSDTEKKTALEVLVDRKLPFDDDLLIDKMAQYLLEEGVESAQQLIDGLHLMGKDRLNTFCNQMKKATRLTALFYRPQKDCNWLNLQQALDCLSTMPAKEYNWWCALFPVHLDINPGSNMLDLLNAHQHFMKKIANWQPALELPGNCAFSKMRNMKTVYAQIINLLECVDNPQEQINYLNDLNFNMQGVPLAVRCHNYRFVHVNQNLVPEGIIPVKNINRIEYIPEDGRMEDFAACQARPNLVSELDKWGITKKYRRISHYLAYSYYPMTIVGFDVIIDYCFIALGIDNDGHFYKLEVTNNRDLKGPNTHSVYSRKIEPKFLNSWGYKPSAIYGIDYGISLQQLLTEEQVEDFNFWRYYGMNPHSSYSFAEIDFIIKALNSRLNPPSTIATSSLLKIIALCTLAKNSASLEPHDDINTLNEIVDQYNMRSDDPRFDYQCAVLKDLSQVKVPPPLSLFPALMKFNVKKFKLLVPFVNRWGAVIYDIIENIANVNDWRNLRAGLHPDIHLYTLFEAAAHHESAVQLQLFSMAAAEDQKAWFAISFPTPFRKYQVATVSCENVTSLLKRFNRQGGNHLTSKEVSQIMQYVQDNSNLSVLELENYFKANFPKVSFNKSPMPASFTELIAGVESAIAMIKPYLGNLNSLVPSLPITQADKTPIDVAKIIQSDSIIALTRQIISIEKACKQFVSEPSVEEHFVALQKEVNALIEACKNLELPIDNFALKLAWIAARGMLVTTLTNNITQTHLGFLMTPCQQLIELVTEKPHTAVLKKYADLITSDKTAGGDFLMHLRQISANISDLRAVLTALKATKSENRRQILALMNDKQVFASSTTASDLRHWQVIINIIVQCHYEPTFVIAKLVDESGQIKTEKYSRLQVVRDNEVACRFSTDEVNQLLELPVELINYYAQAKLNLNNTPCSQQTLSCLLKALVTANPQDNFLKQLQAGLLANAPLYSDLIIELAKNTPQFCANGQQLLSACGAKESLLLPVLQGSCWSMGASFETQTALIAVLVEKVDAQLLTAYQTPPYPTIEQLQTLQYTDKTAWLRQFYCDPHGKRSTVAAQLIDAGVTEFIEKIEDLFSDKAPLVKGLQQELTLAYRDVLALNSNYRFREKQALSTMSRAELLMVFDEILHDRNAPQAQAEMLALACEVMFRVTGQFPFSSQIISVLLAMRCPGNMILGISTGQGKTITNRLLAVMNYAFHHDSENSPVVISSDLMHLAERDYLQGKDFFDYLGLPTHLVNKSTATDISNLAGENTTDKPSIIFSTMEDFGLHLLAIKDQYKVPNFAEAKQRIHAVAQCDEGDSVVYDRLSDLNLSTGSNPLQEHPLTFAYKVAYHFIREELKDLIDDNRNREHVRKLFHNRLKTEVNAQYEQHLAALSDQVIDDLLDATASASNRSLKENIDFKLVKITRAEDQQEVSQIRLIEKHQDDKEGTSVYKDGVQQALLARLNIEYQRDILLRKMPAFPVSNQSNTRQAASIVEVVCGFFSRALFTTGSPGIHSELTQAKRYFNVQHAVQIPDKRTGVLHFLPTEFARNQQKSWFGKKAFPEAIARHCNNRSQQPHLIFRKNIPDAHALYHQLGQSLGYDKVQMLHANVVNSHEELQAIVAKARQKGIITIATPYAGRGVHIDPRLAESLDNAVDELAALLSVTITFPPDSERERLQMEGRTARDGLDGECTYIYNLDELLHLPLKGETAQRKCEILLEYTLEQDKKAAVRREDYLQLALMRSHYANQVPFAEQVQFFEDFERINKSVREQSLPSAEIIPAVNQAIAVWVSKKTQQDCPLFSLPNHDNQSQPAWPIVDEQSTDLARHYVNRFKPTGDYAKALDVIMEMDKPLRAGLSQFLSLQQAIQKKVIQNMGSTDHVLAAYLGIFKTLCVNAEMPLLNRVRPLLIHYALTFNNLPVTPKECEPLWQSIKAMIQSVAQKQDDFENLCLSAVMDNIDDTKHSFTAKKNAAIDALFIWQQQTQDRQSKMVGQTLIDVLQSVHFADNEATNALTTGHSQLKAFLQQTKNRITTEHRGHQFTQRKVDMIEEYLQILDQKQGASWPELMRCTVQNMTLKEILAKSTRTGKDSTLETVSSQQLCQLEKQILVCEQKAQVSAEHLTVLKNEATEQINQLISGLERRQKKATNYFWLNAGVYQCKIDLMKTLQSQTVDKIASATNVHDLEATIRLFTLNVIHNPQLSQRAGKYFAAFGSVKLLEEVKKISQTIDDRMMSLVVSDFRAGVL